MGYFVGLCDLPSQEREREIQSEIRFLHLHGLVAVCRHTNIEFEKSECQFSVKLGCDGMIWWDPNCDNSGSTTW